MGDLVSMCTGSGVVTVLIACGIVSIFGAAVAFAIKMFVTAILDDFKEGSGEEKSFKVHDQE